MAEKFRGHESPYWRHIEVMPATHNCTLSWDTKDIALLKQTDFGNSLQEDVDGMYANEILPVTTAHPTVWPAESCTRAAFEWAAGMVQSRAFHLQASNWATNEITEGRNIAPGEEILHTYGDLGNGELLQVYGFVEAPGVNPFDAVGFSTGEIVDAVLDSGDYDCEALNERMASMLLDGIATPRMLVQAKKKPFMQLCSCVLVCTMLAVE
ncbi:hypothetical protein H632_c104p0 [Helicosporidium sp. ATCC 50920]|nr:hypothetical protein H632_c104p0 [Helicosporidium sp. ATCC 50920]|eukprot:KDD76789.1 hypothetical protein H632_c104p0 [Helicosporidium sp. ATCC 50920]